MILNMVKDIKNFLTNAHIRANIVKENPKVLEGIPGPTVNSMKDNGSMEWSKALGCGEEPKVIHTSANGNMEKQMVMEYTLGWMEIDTKVSFHNV